MIGVDMGVAEAFSPSYQKARVKFLEAAATAGLALESHAHPNKGRDGEDLAMDVARSGPLDAAKVLLLSSACHGVEGFCGSGVQVFALHDQEWLDHAKSQGVAVVYVHALNPHGFSNLRRVTQENVDLNRNFHDYSQPLPVNKAYRDLADLLVPATWPPDAANAAATQAYIDTQGMKAFQAAGSGGQHEYPQGLFYGGKAPTWSNQTVRKVLRQHAGQTRQLAWIDLHTGLGPNGLGERICASGNNPAQIARARQWWDGGGATPVTSIYDGSSASAMLTGLMWSAVEQECPQAKYTGIAMEYGTVPMMDVFNALRADQWLQNNPGAAPDVARQIKKQILDAFYTDTDAWKGQIIAQARQALFQAVDGLAAT